MRKQFLVPGIILHSFVLYSQWSCYLIWTLNKDSPPPSPFWLWPLWLTIVSNSFSSFSPDFLHHYVSSTGTLSFPFEISSQIVYCKNILCNMLSHLQSIWRYHLKIKTFIWYFKLNKYHAIYYTHSIKTFSWSMNSVNGYAQLETWDNNMHIIK